MGKSIVKKTGPLPSIEYIEGLRKLGAKTISTADLHVEFTEVQGIYPSAMVLPRAPYARPYVAGNAPRARPDDDPNHDIAEDELTAEELQERERQNHEALLLASAD